MVCVFRELLMCIAGKSKEKENQKFKKMEWKKNKVTLVRIWIWDGTDRISWSCVKNQF